MDALFEALPDILKLDLALVIANTGAPPAVARFQTLAKEYAGDLACVASVDERFTRQLFAGADLALVLSAGGPGGTPGPEIEPFVPAMTLRRPIDMKLGTDGARAMWRRAAV